MLGLSGGELFIVVFITLAVVSASAWPRLGEAVAERLAGHSRDDARNPQGDGSESARNREDE